MTTLSEPDHFQHFFAMAINMAQQENQDGDSQSPDEQRLGDYSLALGVMLVLRQLTLHETRFDVEGDHRLW
jgi:hypothetical protein